MFRRFRHAGWKPGQLYHGGVRPALSVWNLRKPGYGHGTDSILLDVLHITRAHFTGSGKEGGEQFRAHSVNRLYHHVTMFILQARREVLAPDENLFDEVDFAPLKHLRFR